MTNEELIALIASNAEAIARLEVNAVTQVQGLASLQASAESQARTMELMREGMTYNTEVVANALEISAISQRTAAAAQESAAAAFQLSASTARAIDRSEQNITRLEQMLDIIIKDNQADRARITRLED
jgi:hypothetical protein